MERHVHPDLARILVDKQTIDEHVAQLARQIEAEYADAERVYLIGVLKGAFIFLADLARELRIPHVVDFIAVSSYGKSAQSGQVRFIMDTREPVDGEHVIIVEDIVDTGNTLRYLVENFHGRNPASLRTCALVRKERSQIGYNTDYLGFEIPDVWVVGYGLDYADTHRTLPFIAELKPEVYQKQE